MQQDKLEQWVTADITFKGVLKALLVMAVLGAGYWLWKQLPEPPAPIYPIILIADRYPLTEQDKEFYRQVNPYGILLGIPAREDLDPLQFRQEMEEVLGRKNLMLFIDQEGGQVNRVKQFEPGFSQRSARKIGEIASKNLKEGLSSIRKDGSRLGKLLKERKVDVVFAPNAEVSYSDEDPQRSRYYSDDPILVQQLADAYAESLAAEGVTPTFKHIMGTSVTAIDPHWDRQIVNSSAEHLRNKDLIPFAHASRWPFLMTAHALYTALDDENISTYSKPFYEFIRKELDFDGLIITDALNMESAGLDSPEEIGDRMNQALAAGADIVLPIFNRDASTDWIISQVKGINLQYIKRFHKRMEELQQKGYNVWHTEEPEAMAAVR